MLVLTDRAAFRCVVVLTRRIGRCVDVMTLALPAVSPDSLITYA